MAWICCASSDRWAAGLAWDQVTRAETGEFCRWLRITGKPAGPHWRTRRAGKDSEAGTVPVAGGPSPGDATPQATGSPTPPTSATAWKADLMAGPPELDIARVRRWCDQRVPTRARDQVRVECDIGSQHLTIVECRPPWREGIGPEWTRFPIARLRYTQAILFGETP
jgi:hypothetical protein